MAIKVGGTTVVDDSRNITGISISGLTTPLSAAQGGTGVTSATGTGNVVLSTSPVLTTPDLGIPSAVTLTNATGLPVATGISGLGTGVATFLATPSSANLASALTDESGSGTVAFTASPTFTGTVAAASLTLSGDLIVNGTTTTINSTTLTVDDKNIELGSVATPSDVTADGGGITLKGATDKTISWSSVGWTSSEDFNLVTGKAYEINGTSVLSGSTLGSGVTGSSLTSVGTIGTGVWQGSEISTTYTAAKVTSVNGSTGAVSGLATTAGTLAQFGATTSSQLLGVISDETGSGALVFATSPTLVTPALGTPSSGTLSSCTVDGTDAVGFRNVPQNSQSAAYTAVLSDSGKHIFHPASDANARTFTIPANASVAYPIGTVISFSNMTSQVVTIAITSDTMYLGGQGTTGNRSLAQYGVANALKITSTSWIITGTGLT